MSAWISILISACAVTPGGWAEAGNAHLVRGGRQGNPVRIAQCSAVGERGDGVRRLHAGGHVGTQGRARMWSAASPSRALACWGFVVCCLR